MHRAPLEMTGPARDAPDTEMGRTKLSPQKLPGLRRNSKERERCCREARKPQAGLFLPKGRQASKRGCALDKFCKVSRSSLGRRLGEVETKRVGVGRRGGGVEGKKERDR